MERLLFLVIFSVSVVFVNCGDLFLTKEHAQRKQRYQDELNNYKDFETYPYYELKRDAKELTGNRIKLRGEVMNVQKEGDTQFIQLNVTQNYYGSWIDQVIVVYNGGTQVYDEDFIHVYGKIRGFHTYTSQANHNITVPLVFAEYISVW